MVSFKSFNRNSLICSKHATTSAVLIDHAESIAERRHFWKESAMTDKLQLSPLQLANEQPLNQVAVSYLPGKMANPQKLLNVHLSC